MIRSLPAEIANPFFVIVGLGSAGERAMQVIQSQRPGAEFAIVSSRSVEGKNSWKYDSLSQLEGLRADAIIVTGPATRRLEVLKQIGPGNIPIFFEKPIASSLREALLLKSMLGLAEHSSQVGYNLRFSKSLRFFRELVRSREFGRTLRFSAETGQYLPDWRPGRDYRESVSARSEFGGGVLLELSHELDYLRWVFGEWQWVSAWFGKSSELQIDVEDTAVVSVGITPALEEPTLVGQLSLDFLRRDKARVITAVCENASIRWDGVIGKVEMRDSSTESWVSIFTDSDPGATYDAQWASFLSVLEHGLPPVVGVNDGIRVLEIIEAIRKSHDEGGARVSISSLARHS